MRLIHTIFTIGGLTFLSRLLGFVRDILIASLLGAGPLADAFFAAFKIPNFFRRLFAEGAFSSAFIPLYAKILTKEGLKEAQQMAEDVFAFLFIILLFLVIVFEMNMPFLMKLLTPGFETTPERMDAVIIYGRITFPYILFISLGALMSGILNSHGLFSAAASAPILLNVCMIGGLCFGLDYFPTAGHALSYTAVFAGFLQFMWVYAALHPLKLSLKLRRPRLTVKVKKLLKAMIPAIIGGGIVQINLLTDIILASFLPTGAVSYLYYADRLNQLPLSMIGIAFSTALLPSLSKDIAQKFYEKAQYKQNRIVEMALLLTLPATLALFILAEPIMTVLFERDAFDHKDVKETANTLSAFVLGLPAYVLIKILSTSFFAHGNVRTPANTGVVTFLLNLLLTFLLMNSLKHVGFALATSLSAWMNVGLLAYFLKDRSLFIMDDRFRVKVRRIILSSFIMGLFLIPFQMYWPYEASSFLQGSFLMSIIFFGFLTFMGMCFLTHAIHFDEIKRIVYERETPKLKDIETTQ